jgi:hypothetical protein
MATNDADFKRGRGSWRPREHHSLVVGCTDRGTHRWTTLHTWRFVHSEEDGRWTPARPGEVLPLRCPRCGRAPRFGGKPGGRGDGLAELERVMRENPGRHRLDISQFQF